MMDPALKFASGLCVLMMGVCAAMLFRHDRPQPTLPAPNAEQETLLRWQVDSALAGLKRKKAARSASASRDVPQTADNVRPATIVTPLDRHESPPSLAPDYPETGRPAANPRWGVSMEMMLPAAAPTDQTASTHTIVDGDTLASLAERYLGAAGRANEIFQANRDVLSNPDLLPIGVELKLPPRKR
jgi:nucleoid-associated protein YgaU